MGAGGALNRVEYATRKSTGMSESKCCTMGWGPNIKRCKILVSPDDDERGTMVGKQVVFAYDLSIHSTRVSRRRRCAVRRQKIA